MKALSSLYLTGVLLVAACAPDPVAAPSQPVARVEVSPQETTLAVGETIQLTATLRDRFNRVLTGRTVTWSTGPTVVLAVSPAGLVTTHDAGSAVVSATSEGREGRVTVNVVREAAPVASITIDRTALQLVEGDETRLIATVRDAKGNPLEGRDVQWTSSNPSVASVTPAGDVTAIRNGAAEIVATVEGKRATASVEVSHHYPFALVYNDWFDQNFPTRLMTARLGTEGEPLFPADVLPGWRLSQAKQSPDRRSFVFMGHADYYSAIFVINADGTGLRELVVGEEPTWSPDGTQIAYVGASWDGDADIWVINRDGTGAVNLTDHLGETDQLAPAWSPELAGESRIAFAHGLWYTGTSIWTMRPDGSDPRPLTTDAALIDDYPAWSPDGARLVFTRWEREDGDGDLWVVEADGTVARLLRLPGSQLTPAWSPDGQLIAFASGHEEPNAHKIYTVWSDGTKLARRTEGVGWHGNPAWRLYR